MSQQDQISPASAPGQTGSSPPSPPVAAAANAPTPQPLPGSRSSWGRLAIPSFAVLAAFGFIVLATLRWDAWVGGAVIQTTNDAYVRAELTRLSSRVAGEVLIVAANDFQRVKAGDLLVQIDPADYEAQVAQAEAGVAGAQAALDNLDNQVELQYATIAQGEAQQVSALAQEVGERQVQPGDYVNIGSNLINVVPLPNVYVVANYKETQLTRVKPGQPVDVTVDSFPSERLHGRVERIAPASGSQFALLPPDNATGNFTKVVQRIPVRIGLDKGQPVLERLLPGMSVVTRIHTDEAGPDGGK